MYINREGYHHEKAVFYVQNVPHPLRRHLPAPGYLNLGPDSQWRHRRSFARHRADQRQHQRHRHHLPLHRHPRHGIQLPKRIPATDQAGETVIDSTVFTVDEADLHLLDDPRLNDWVEVVETNTLENDNVEVLFYIAVPGDLPTGDYEFTAITDGLDLDIGTTVLHFIIK